MNGPWLMPIEDDPYKEIERLQAEVERLKQRNQLEAAVVAAALAERRAGYELTRGHLFEPPPGAEAGWLDALGAYEQAIDALLAFHGEEADENAEMRARLKAGLAAVMELAKLVEEAGDE